MAYNKNLVLRVLVFIFLATLAAAETCNFPAIYNFGDSNSDTRTDEFAVNGSKCIVDHDGKPKRTQSNGRLIIDFIAMKLEKPYLSSYADKIGTDFKHGANFAIGGSTIMNRNDPVFPYLGDQISKFAQFKAQSISSGRKESLCSRPKDFSKALYTIDIGQNDISRAVDDGNTQVVPDLINELATGVKNLYDLGARTFWIHNTGPTGCLSTIQVMRKKNVCAELDEFHCLKAYNDVAKEFNKQLKEKVVELRAELTEAAITYVDVYVAKYKLYNNPLSLGFNDPFAKGIITDPLKNMFWDGLHYTEAANRLIAADILDGSLSDLPLDIVHACSRN